MISIAATILLREYLAYFANIVRFLFCLLQEILNPATSFRLFLVSLF